MRIGVFAWALLGVGLAAASARAAEIDVACPRLDAEHADELRARVKLVLRSSAESPKSILVACNDSRAWVVWNGPPAEFLDVPADTELVEALLDAIDRRARGKPVARKSPKPRARRGPIPTSPHETPTWERAEAPEPPPKPLVESGGIGLALVSELLGAPLEPTLGPRLDIGVGWGPWSLQLAESARFGNTKSGEATLFYDLGAGFGWGAPFSRRYLFGAVLFGGSEWFNVESHTTVTGFGTLGLRAAVPMGAFSLAFGLDGRYRFSPQHVGDRVDVATPHFSGLVFVEGLLLVEPPVKEHHVEEE